MTQEVSDARKAIEIAKDYAEVSMAVPYWQDVIECNFDQEIGEWHIVFAASPSLLANYYEYEITIDSKTRNVVSARRIKQ